MAGARTCGRDELRPHTVRCSYFMPLGHARNSIARRRRSTWTLALWNRLRILCTRCLCASLAGGVYFGTGLKEHFTGRGGDHTATCRCSTPMMRPSKIYPENRETGSTDRTAIVFPSLIKNKLAHPITCNRRPALNACYNGVVGLSVSRSIVSKTKQC